MIEREHFVCSFKIETLPFSTATRFLIAISIPPSNFLSSTENFTFLAYFYYFLALVPRVGEFPSLVELGGGGVAPPTPIISATGLHDYQTNVKCSDEAFLVWLLLRGICIGLISVLVTKNLSWVTAVFSFELAEWY